MARLQKRKQAAVTTGTAEQPAFPARRVYDLYVVSPGTGFLAPVTCELVAIRRFDLSTGRSGPHDFAVRVNLRSSSATRRGHRIPHSTSVTTRTPLAARRDATLKHEF